MIFDRIFENENGEHKHTCDNCGNAWFHAQVTDVPAHVYEARHTCEKCGGIQYMKTPLVANSSPKDRGLSDLELATRLAAEIAELADGREIVVRALEPGDIGVSLDPRKGTINVYGFGPKPPELVAIEKLRAEGKREEARALRAVVILDRMLGKKRPLAELEREAANFDASRDARRANGADFKIAFADFPPIG